HTSFSRDWSSDVCSSDLIAAGPEVELVIDPEERARHERMAAEIAYLQSELAAAEQLLAEAAEKETKFNELRRLKAELQAERAGLAGKEGAEERIDRKSTRLNSSHVKISYAVFCLKK